MTDDDDFDREYIRRLTLKCSDCGLIYRKKQEYVCPACFGRNVVRPTAEEFDQFYTESE
jgi:DNA-directed RNA polymerase subunit RPC12/RpoP